MKKITGFLQLMRPANIITSISDVLAGVAISGFLTSASFSVAFVYPIAMLCVAAIGLYGGGIVFNDICDVELDKIERPERPIPSGAVKLWEALVLGTVLLLTGILSAASVGKIPGLLAISIAIAAILYNKWTKHNSFAGPINMGLCRGLNLLLGASIVAISLWEWWYIAFIPILYIAAITMISRGEVHGGKKYALYFAALLYCIVISGILLLSYSKGMVWFSILFLLPFAWMIFPALIKSMHRPVPTNIGKAVKAGVIALILMNACWAAAFGSIKMAFAIICLLPLSIWLSKIFAVT